ncbi:MAG TPA: helix-turn-helix domain-containing protein [Stellaceae bacterium]|nr:helix-turn-helix domain-containing protein [Stellaceae bacterium]
MRERNRRQARDLVLDAAERLLSRAGADDFSMRALAAEAGVGFATPFNHFGSKNAIMQALSARLIDRMATAFRAAAPPGDAIDRIWAMNRIAADLLLERPEVHKVVVGSLGLPNSDPKAGQSAVMAHSRALWSLALGEFDGLVTEMRGVGALQLARQLAYVFRGCLSFWIAGELAVDKLLPAVDAAASTVLLGFVVPERRAEVLDRISSVSL